MISASGMALVEFVVASLTCEVVGCIRGGGVGSVVVVVEV